MMICPPDRCTGCSACMNACPLSCIGMAPDAYGEMHPVVEEDKCIRCGKCVRVCPSNNELDFNAPLACFAVWNTDGEKRRLSASGGVAAALSEFVTGRSGVVYGTCLDATLVPRVECAGSPAETEKFKGSKYVQSETGFSLREIGKRLLAGESVLFTGTPCQVSGLRSFLGGGHDNLILADLICHGVCPAGYLKEEIEYLRHKKGWGGVDAVRFRGNDGNNYKLSLWRGGKCLYVKPAYSQYYFAGFLKGVTLRENCYSCRYARPERISDLTLGDFIGLGEKAPFRYDPENVSSVTVNTEKGRRFFEEMLECTPSVMCVRRDYSERLAYAPSLRTPAVRDGLNCRFRTLYLQEGFVRAIRKTLWASVWRYSVSRFISRKTGYLKRAPGKVARIVKEKMNKLWA